MPKYSSLQESGTSYKKYFVYSYNRRQNLGSCVKKSSKIKQDKKIFTAWKLSKYGVFSGSYFPVFGINTGKTDQKKLRICALFA